MPLTALLALVFFAQVPSGANTLAVLAQSDLAGLDTRPTLAIWRGQHQMEQLKPAAFGVEYDGWCAASIARIDLSDGITATRQALFYVPRFPPDNTLPANVDKRRTGQCRLLAFWYEVQGPASFPEFAGNLSREVRPGMGDASDLPRFDRHRQGWGQGYWTPFYYRDLKSKTVVIGADPKGLRGQPRALLIARSSALPPENRSFDLAEPPAVAAPAVTLADLGAPPTRPDAAIKWIEAARALPPDRQAAALLLADRYVAQARNLAANPDGKRLIALGLHFENTREGPQYSHTLREEAERVDPTGPGGELARIDHLSNTCSFEGKSDWREGLIPFGETFLKDYPNSTWKAHVHRLLGRAYEAKLLLSYPELPDYSNPNHGPIQPVPLRASAIAHFRQALADDPDHAQTYFIWSEAWRLLADLPPTPISFGCTDE